MTRLIAALCAAALLAGCATTSKPPSPDADGWAGGYATPSPVPVTGNPNTTPIGDTVPTGIVMGGYELVLYFWGSGEHPYLDVAWRETASAHATGGHGPGAGVMFLEGSSTFESRHLMWKDETVDFGLVRAPVAKLTSTFAGRVIDARFTRWSADPQVTIFWMRGHDTPLPRTTPDADGRTEPLAPDRYPLIVAYDADGNVSAQGRLRPPATGPKTV